MSELPPELSGPPPAVCSDDFESATTTEAAGHISTDWILLPKVRLTLKEVEIYGTLNFKSNGDY